MYAVAQFFSNVSSMFTSSPTDPLEAAKTLLAKNDLAQNEIGHARNLLQSIAGGSDCKLPPEVNYLIGETYRLEAYLKDSLDDQGDAMKYAINYWSLAEEKSYLPAMLRLGRFYENEYDLGGKKDKSVLKEAEAHFLKIIIALTTKNSSRTKEDNETQAHALVHLAQIHARPIGKQQGNLQTAANYLLQILTNASLQEDSEIVEKALSLLNSLYANNEEAFSNFPDNKLLIKSLSLLIDKQLVLSDSMQRWLNIAKKLAPSTTGVLLLSCLAEGRHPQYQQFRYDALFQLGKLYLNPNSSKQLPEIDFPHFCPAIKTVLHSTLVTTDDIKDCKQIAIGCQGSPQLLKSYIELLRIIVSIPERNEYTEQKKAAAIELFDACLKHGVMVVTDLSPSAITEWMKIIVVSSAANDPALKKCYELVCYMVLNKYAIDNWRPALRELAHKHPNAANLIGTVYYSYYERATSARWTTPPAIDWENATVEQRVFSMAWNSTPQISCDYFLKTAVSDFLVAATSHHGRAKKSLEDLIGEIDKYKNSFSSDVLFQLGQLFSQYGLSTPHGKLAKQFLKTAENQNHVHAAFLLGQKFLELNRYDKALLYFFLAAKNHQRSTLGAEKDQLPGVDLAQIENQLNELTSVHLKQITRGELLFELSQMYVDGDGLTKDEQKSYKLLNVAAGLGCSTARRAIAEAEKAIGKRQQKVEKRLEHVEQSSLNNDGDISELPEDELGGL